MLRPHFLRAAPAALLLVLAVALVLDLAAAAGPRAADTPLEITAATRDWVAGEGVRIDVVSPEPLRELSGRFLETDVFMMPDESGHRWYGWSLIDLDQEPGSAAIQMRGTLQSGGGAHGTHAVRILPKEFPKEHLSVAPKYVEPPAEVRERLARERARLATIYANRQTVPAPSSPFRRPVPGDPTSIFGSRRVFNGKPRSPHSGLDLRAATGTEVLCSGPGTVVLAEELYYSGNVVIVDHGGGLFTLYAHLSRIDVAKGDPIAAGSPVGLSGATGRVTGPHLHWGAKIGNVPFDPRSLMDPALF